MTRIMIIGATSAIAEAAARCFAADGDRIFLVARNEDKLNAVAGDLRVRGAAQAETCVMDATDYERHQSVIDEAFTKLNGLDAVLIAYGTLPDQVACELDARMLRREFEVNALSVMALLTHLASIFERQGRGTLAVITSVAGDRGRQSNYVYGSAKGAVSLFLQGLRNRLHRSGVRVLNIKPGFVDTPMTADFEKGLLWASPEAVARGIHKAIRQRRDCVYVPWFWRVIMTVIKAIPEFIFKRMRL